VKKRDHPIFVVGYQRSGTTLLQALLGAHSRIASPPETYFLMRISNLRDYYGDLRDDANLRRALHDTIEPPLPLFEGCGFDEEALYERALETDRSYRALFHTVMSDFAQRHAKARWCDKTPGQRARQILQLFPDAQIVHIVRDPRDVIASSLATPWTTMDAAGLARGWRRFTLDNLAVGQRAGPERFHQIRYEDLTRDPTTVLRGVCSFLGERFEPAMITDRGRRRATIAPTAGPWQSRALEDISPAREGGWRTRLRRSDAAVVSAILRAEFGPLGYEASSAVDVLLGRALSVRETPRAIRRGARNRRLRRISRDPAARHREVDRFLREQAELVGRGAEKGS
jgi:sulfotransferase family protein